MIDALARRLWESPLLSPWRGRSRRRQAELADAFAALAARHDETTVRLDRLWESVSQMRAGMQRIEDLVTMRPGDAGGDAPDRRPATGIRIAMAPDFDDFMRQVEVNYRDLAAPFSDYRRLVTALADRRGDLELLPVTGFADRRPGPDEPSVVTLRHDIDADPVTGLRCARHLAREGVPGTFYLLPTAGYYGRYEAGRFLRNPRLVGWVRGFIVAGAELGVHNDALGLSATGLVDGAEALVAELDWLRSQGAVVRTTAGHNSAPSQGAENMEVFRGRVLWTRTDAAPTPPELPLAALDEATLGLTAEGTFAVPRPDADPAAAEAFCRVTPPGIRDAGWMRTYLLDNPCLDWDVDLQCWQVGRDEWVIGGRPGRPGRPGDGLDGGPGTPVFEHMVGLERVLSTLDAHARGCRILFVLHPAYVRGPEPSAPGVVPGRRTRDAIPESV
jgi:hypothetical protein